MPIGEPQKLNELSTWRIIECIDVRIHWNVYIIDCHSFDNAKYQDYKVEIA